MTSGRRKCRHLPTDPRWERNAPLGNAAGRAYALRCVSTKTPTKPNHHWAVLPFGQAEVSILYVPIWICVWFLLGATLPVHRLHTLHYFDFPSQPALSLRWCHAKRNDVMWKWKCVASVNVFGSIRVYVVRSSGSAFCYAQIRQCLKKHTSRRASGERHKKQSVSESYQITWHGRRRRRGRDCTWLEFTNHAHIHTSSLMPIYEWYDSVYSIVIEYSLLVYIYIYTYIVVVMRQPAGFLYIDI